MPRPLTVAELISALEEMPDYWETDVFAVSSTTVHDGSTVVTR